MLFGFVLEDTWLFALTYSPTRGNSQTKTIRFDDRLSLERVRHELKKSSLRHRRSDTGGALHPHTYFSRQSLRTNGYEVAGVQQWVLGTFVAHAFRGVVTGTWTSAPAFTYAGHYPTSSYRPTYSFVWVPRFGHPCWLPASPCI